MSCAPAERSWSRWAQAIAVVALVVGIAAAALSAVPREMDCHSQPASAAGTRCQWLFPLSCCAEGLVVPQPVESVALLVVWFRSKREDSSNPLPTRSEASPLLRVIAERATVVLQL